MSKRILIVEDDPAISKLIDTNLSVSGHQTFCALDGCQALDAILSRPFDLAPLDIMLPETDSFKLLPYIQKKQIPVINVSAKADVQSLLQGLRLGAEDYLVKPFDILELLVFMEKVLAWTLPAPEVVTFYGVTLNEGSHTVFQSGLAIPFQPMEYKLQHAL